jgi:hypothetical protein
MHALQIACTHSHQLHVVVGAMTVLRFEGKAQVWSAAARGLGDWMDRTMKGRRKVDGKNPFFGKFTGANSGANFAHFPLFFGTKPWYADRTNSYHGTRQSLPKFLKAKRCLL